MRTLFVFLLFFLSAAKPLGAQTQKTLAENASYASTDTTAWVGIRPDRDYSGYILFRDSANVTIRLDYSFSSVVKTSVRFQSYNIVSDSTNYTDTLGTVKGFTLRRGGTDNVPGAAYLRLVITRKTTGNPARASKTPFYSSYVWEPQ